MKCLIRLASIIALLIIAVCGAPCRGPYFLFPQKKVSKESSRLLFLIDLLRVRLIVVNITLTAERTQKQQVIPKASVYICSLSERLRSFRKTHSYTTEKIRKLLGVHWYTVLRIEQCKDNIHPAIITKVDYALQRMGY